MYENWKFERWETPVSEIRDLGMESLIDDGERLTVVINTGERHVRFVFSDFPAYRNIRELYRTELWNKLYQRNLGSTLLIPESEWVEEFRRDRELLDVCHPNAVHYMINTDDGCVEVLSNEPPEISVIEVISDGDTYYGRPDV